MENLKNRKSPRRKSLPPGGNGLAEELEAYLGSENRQEGILATDLPGVSIFQSRIASVSRHTVYKPVICAVVQGAKRVRLGNMQQDCVEGQLLAIGFDAVLKSTILRGSPERPYRAVALELDFELLQEVAASMPELSLPEKSEGPGLFVEDNREPLGDAFRRLFSLLRTPSMIPVLAPGIQREIAWHLLSGPHGRDFLRFSFPGSRTRILSDAVRRIQHDIARPLRVPALAESIGMSLSSFHQQFKKLTSYSPIQYQKRLRLLEARRILRAEGAYAEEAAYRVGYRSPSQFNREYTRLFGVSPHRDKVAASYPKVAA